MKKAIQIVLQISIIIFLYSSKKLTECQEVQTALNSKLKCADPVIAIDNFWSSSNFDGKAFVMVSPDDDTFKYVVRTISYPYFNIEELPQDLVPINKMKSKFAIATFGNFVLEDNRFIFYEYFTSFRFFDLTIDGEKLKNDKDLLHFIIKLAYAIADLHFHDYVHANLNIESIMMICDSPKITKFNYAVPYNEPYEFHGSLAYASPEFISNCLGDLSTTELQNKLKNNIKSDPAYISKKMKNTLTQGYENDMYAIGVIIYIITQKKLPFDETSAFQTILQKLSGKITIKKATHPDIRKLIQGLMAKDPAKRFNILDLTTYLYNNRQ